MRILNQKRLKLSIELVNAWQQMANEEGAA